MLADMKMYKIKLQLLYRRSSQIQVIYTPLGLGGESLEMFWTTSYFPFFFFSLTF